MAYCAPQTLTDINTECGASMGGVRIATVRAHDGRFTLSIEGAERLWRHLPAPTYRVSVAEEVAEFIMKGKNAMAKHVILLCSSKNVNKIWLKNVELSKDCLMIV